MTDLREALAFVGALLVVGLLDLPLTMLGVPGYPRGFLSGIAAVYVFDLLRSIEIE